VFTQTIGVAPRIQRGVTLHRLHLFAEENGAVLHIEKAPRTVRAGIAREQRGNEVAQTPAPCRATEFGDFPFHERAVFAVTGARVHDEQENLTLPHRDALERLLVSLGQTHRAAFAHIRRRQHALRGGHVLLQLRAGRLR